MDGYSEKVGSFPKVTELTLRRSSVNIQTPVVSQSYISPGKAGLVRTRPVVLEIPEEFQEQSS